MSKPPLDSSDDIDKIAKNLLIASKAWGVFPTPVDQIVQYAELQIENGIDLSTVDPGFFATKLEFVRSALSKVVGIVDFRHKTIYLDQSQKTPRKNFVKLHEVGHKACSWQSDLKGFMDDEKTLDPDIDDQFEREASYFASGGWVVFEQDATHIDPNLCLHNNAQWLRSKGVPFIPREVDLSKYLYVSPDEKLAPLFSEAKKRAFYSALIRASNNGIEAFFLDVSKLLVELAGCSYASVLACAPAKDFLTLTAIYPEPHPGTLEDTTPNLNDALAGDTIHGQMVKVFNLKKPGEIERSTNFRFLMGLSSMASIPVANTSNTNHIRYIINLYDEKKQFPDNHDEDFYEIAEHIAISADKVLDDACSAAAGRIDAIETYAQTAARYVARLRLRILKEFECECVSIFLVNEENDKLEYFGEDSNISWIRPEHFYRRDEGITGRVWKENQFILTRNASGEKGFRGISNENLLSDRDESLLAPISTFNGRVLGVVRCVNKCKTKEALNRTVATMFSDDDAALLEAMLQAAAPRLEILLKYRRLAQSIANVPTQLDVPFKIIEENCKKNKTEDLSDALQAITLARAVMKNQFYVCEHSSKGLKPKIKLVKLHEDIIKPAIRQSLVLLRQEKFGLSNFQIDPKMPRVFVDEEMFVQLFFNLISNAFKFRLPDAQLKVMIGYNRDSEDGSTRIIFADRGVGIPEEVRGLVFSAGFRLGLGLYVCRQIVDAHNFKISLADVPHRTQFEITLPPQHVRYDEDIPPTQT